MIDEDTNDAWWAQAESEQWQRHVETVREFRDFLTDEGFMKTSQMVQSKFLKKEDFPQPEVLTIRSVAIEEVGKSDTRWVMYFNEKTKAVVLNITKIRQLEAGFGDDTDYWIGKKVKVSNDPTVMMGQQVVGGIKFTLGKTAAPPPPPKPVAATTADDFDDEIPF